MISVILRGDIVANKKNAIPVCIIKTWKSLEGFFAFTQSWVFKLYTVPNFAFGQLIIGVYFCFCCWRKYTVTYLTLSGSTTSILKAINHVQWTNLKYTVSSSNVFFTSFLNTLTLYVLWTFELSCPLNISWRGIKPFFFRKTERPRKIIKPEILTKIIWFGGCVSIRKMRR